MKRLLVYFLSAISLFAVILFWQVDTIAAQPRISTNAREGRTDEPTPDTDRRLPRTTTPVYTTLSLGNEFLYQITSYDTAFQALDIYKKFEAGLATQGFNYANLASQSNMKEAGRINADINQGSGNVSYVISQFNSLFRNNLGCILDNNTLDNFSTTIQSGFDVSTSTKRSFLIFHKRSGSSHTCVYKLLAGSIQTKNGKTTLTLVPTEITVNVSIKVKKILGITTKKSKHYDVHINASSYVYNFN